MSKLVYKKLSKDDPKIRNVDISLVNKILNWSYKVERRQGKQKQYNILKIHQNLN